LYGIVHGALLHATTFLQVLEAVQASNTNKLVLPAFGVLASILDFTRFSWSKWYAVLHTAL